LDDLRGFQLKIKDVPGVATPSQTTVKLPIHPEVTGIPKTMPISFLWVIIPPGCSTDLHAHEFSDEYEYIVSGTGLLEAGQEKDIALEPEMLVYNPLGIVHRVKNTGKDTVKLLRVHVPPLKPVEPGDPIEKAINKAKVWFAEISDKR